jgi:hypothetical protein
MKRDTTPRSVDLRPKPVAYRSGCKVSWNYYATLAEAEIAKGYAIEQGRRDAALGYDFGFCSPGSVHYIDPEKYPNSKYAGLFEVCFS